MFSTLIAVKKYYNDTIAQYSQIKELLNNSKNPVVSLSELKKENLKLKKQVELLLKEKLLQIKVSSKNEIKNLNGINFLAKKVDLDVSNIKNLSFELAGELKNLFLIFIAENNSKATIVCYISKELVKSKGLDAREEVKKLSALIDGSGGGQDFFATAGGSNIEGVSLALDQAFKRFN